MAMPGTDSAPRSGWIQRSVLGLAATGAAATAAAQEGFTVTAVAVAPLTAQWTNAPVGTPGALAAAPTGPFDTVSLLIAPAGEMWARLDCTLTATGERHEFVAESVAAAPFLQSVATAADVLLLAEGPGGVPVDVEVELEHMGDFPMPIGFQVDVGDDGSIEMTAESQACCASRQLRGFVRPLDGVLPIRITHHNAPISPQAYRLRVTLQPWADGATPVAAACGGVALWGTPAAATAVASHLSVLPGASSRDPDALQALGAGPLGVFAFAGPPNVLPLLTPWSPQVCDVLSDVALLHPGIVVSGGVTTTRWRLELPTLPAGVPVHVQHVSLDAAIGWFGASNRVRILH